MGTTTRQRWLAAGVAVVVFIVTLAVGASRTSEDEQALPDPTPSATPAAATPTPLPTMTPSGPSEFLEFRPNGAPAPPTDADQLTKQLEWAQTIIDDPAASAEELDLAGHVHQLVYRQLTRNSEWDDIVATTVDPGIADRALTVARARRGFSALLPSAATTMPPWEIIEPEPIETLIGLYQEAETTFGIPWEYLAAINLIETGMGRIRGLSTAGARGPMQFIAPTWDRFGEGGDIDDPHDSIMAAGRYLSYEAAIEGGEVAPQSPALLDALWHYNNHDVYVDGVVAYAQTIIDNPRSVYGYHQWEIIYWSSEGDIWLPTGFIHDGEQTAGEYVAANPQ
jgi:hypothetical protein